MTGASRLTSLTAGILVAALALAGCGPGQSPPATGASASAMAGPNGLSPNGLARNGLARNGLARNGLARNGLARNGLASADFVGWFDADPATAAEVMTYVVRCALPAGKSLTFTDPATGAAYAWLGSLGLAPGWASGQSASLAEEQVITACLAAHVNKFGMHVDMSVQGLGAAGTPIPVGKKELGTFSQREGCFFGNLFEDEGVYVGIDHALWDASYSSARACAFDILGLGPSADCPPINNVGPCALICKPDADWNYYTSCGTFVGGSWKTYLPITTRLRPSDVYQCGDGVCQFTESCGTGTAAGSCAADCGTCGVTTKTSGNSQK
jgi:GLTT repeat (6 copies)